MVYSKIHPIGSSLQSRLAHTHTRAVSASEYINKYLNKHLQLRSGIISRTPNLCPTRMQQAFARACVRERERESRLAPVCWCAPQCVCVCVCARVCSSAHKTRHTRNERARETEKERERAFLFIFCGCTTLLPSSFCSVCRQICISQIPIRAWRWGCGNDCNDCNEMGVAGRQDKVAMPRLQLSQCEFVWQSACLTLKISYFFNFTHTCKHAETSTTYTCAQPHKCAQVFAKGAHVARLQRRLQFHIHSCDCDSDSGTSTGSRFPFPGTWLRSKDKYACGCFYKAWQRCITYTYCIYVSHFNRRASFAPPFAHLHAIKMAGDNQVACLPLFAFFPYFSIYNCVSLTLCVRVKLAAQKAAAAREPVQQTSRH